MTYNQAICALRAHNLLQNFDLTQLQQSAPFYDEEEDQTEAENGGEKGENEAKGGETEGEQASTHDKPKKTKRYVRVIVSTCICD